MKTRTVWMVLMLTACGSASKPEVDGGSQPEVDSGVIDAGFDAGAPDAGSTFVDAGFIDGGAACDRPEACTIGWGESPQYPQVVDHHTTFIHTDKAGSFLYVVGGVHSVNTSVTVIYATVRRAKIAADGSLGPWAAAGDLPAVLGFHTQVVSGNRVYLIGGVSRDAAGKNFPSASVLVGTIDDLGMITWKQGTSVGEAVIHGAAEILGDTLYLIGGADAAPKARVFKSALDANGLNGPWTAGAALPQPRTHHASVVREGRIFLFGGFDTQGTPLHEVLKSDHDATGAIIGWRVGGDLPNAPWTASATLWGGSVFVVGGGEGALGQEYFVDRVRRARFLQNNTLGAFEDVATPLPVIRAHVHQSPIFEGRIYSVGGRLQPSFNSMDRVFVGAFKN